MSENCLVVLGKNPYIGIGCRFVNFMPKEIKTHLFLGQKLWVRFSLLAFLSHFHLLLLQCCSNIVFPIVYSAHSKLLPNLLCFFSTSHNFIIFSPFSFKTFCKNYHSDSTVIHMCMFPSGPNTGVIPPNNFLSLQTQSLFRCWLYWNIPLMKR